MNAPHIPEVGGAGMSNDWCITKERGEGFNECKHALPNNLGATDVFNAVLWSYIFAQSSGQICQVQPFQLTFVFYIRMYRVIIYTV